ncbi:MAG: hypothetical protein WBM59_02365, partial [Sedimenticolaceae bacterium]
MFKPLLIGGVLVGTLGAPILHAEQPPAAPTQAPQPSQTSVPAAEPNASATQLPDWVKERRAQLGVSSGEQAAGMPPMGEMPPPPPEIPAWVKEQQ